LPGAAAGSEKKKKRMEGKKEKGKTEALCFNMFVDDRLAQQQALSEV